MSKIRLVLAATVILFTQSVFAADDMMEGSSKHKSCEAIAKACKQAGFTRGDKKGKRFWFDCMRPVLLGQSVTGVTIDMAVVKECQEHKISHMKKEIGELEKAVKSNK